MPPIPYKVEKQDHPGSSLDDIWNEPDWSNTSTNDHPIGYYHHGQDRRPGITHSADDEAEAEITRNSERSAIENISKFQRREHQAESGKSLLNFRDLMQDERDSHLEDEGVRSKGQRYVLPVSENWVKNVEQWPANIEKQKKLEAERKKRKEETRDVPHRHQGDTESTQEEHDWRRSQGGNQHHDAYASNPGDDKDEEKEGKGGGGKEEEGKPLNGQQQNNDKTAEQAANEDQDQGQRTPKSADVRLRERYSPQEIALLKALQHDRTYISQLKQSDGRQISPMKGRNRSTINIDEADQFTPDNWIPRSKDLIRETGKHPLNGEPKLTKLFDAGHITPNELHYVRNHGAVPQLRWENFELDIQHGKLILNMDQIRSRFDTINIPVILACDGNRRKELNLISRTKGFHWTAAAVSCSYWKGPLLRDVLRAAGVPESLERKEHSGIRHFVNFEGVDACSEGRYATSIAFQHIMDPTNDVILAYEMNDAPIPPDHGYPLRVIVPGFVGGRSVKWVSKIWISDQENDSYYHIWDNRVLPSFIKERDGAFAETMFRHPDTACMEQNLNSVTVKPAHGEKIALNEAVRGNTYRIQGFAYDGGGHQVQRVEISLDGGVTWLYCLRTYPEAPIRHGTKFWSWLHWHIDVEITHLVRAAEIIVRCFNVFKNTQPSQPVWNILGMMNNCWYRVKTDISNSDDKAGNGHVKFLHPVEPGSGTGGWMRPSQELQIAQAKQQAGTPQKQFTRQEIEKHNNEKDCWLVIDGAVYDATSVLDWHPGGSAAILAHAGRVHQQPTDEFSGIHDDFAWQKLKECALGIVTDRARAFIKRAAQQQKQEEAKASKGQGDVALQKHQWIPARLKERKSISEDTRRYVFELPPGKPQLGIDTCQHIQVGFHMKDSMIIRSYTPILPLLPAPSSTGPREEYDSSGINPVGDTKDSKKLVVGNSTLQDLRDGRGEFTMVVKTYFPNEAQPGGAMSNILDCMTIGEFVELRGPTGDVMYSGSGKFNIEGKKRRFRRVSLVLGGSGITPGYALIARIVLTTDDDTELRVIDANKTEGDILLRKSLDELANKHQKQLTITHILSHPSGKWKGKKGHVDGDIIKEVLFEPSEDSVALLCGPPAMIQKAALPALTDWGYKEGKNCFGF